MAGARDPALQSPRLKPRAAAALQVSAEGLQIRDGVISSKDSPAKRTTFAELVKAKIEGRKIEAPKRPKRTAPSDLMAALRESAALSGKAPPAKARPRRKAG